MGAGSDESYLPVSFLRWKDVVCFGVAISVFIEPIELEKVALALGETNRLMTKDSSLEQGTGTRPEVNL